LLAATLRRARTLRFFAQRAKADDREMREARLEARQLANRVADAVERRRSGGQSRVD
jgi:hypothetical protein